MRLRELPRPDLDRVIEDSLGPPAAFLRAKRDAERAVEYGRCAEELIEHERRLGMPVGPFHREWLIRNVAPERVRKQLQLAREHPHIQGINQSLASNIAAQGVNTVAFAARNTLATELNILQVPGGAAAGATDQATINQYCAIPAGDPQAGRAYEVDAAGIYSNTVTPTLIWTPRWGTSTTVATNISLGASGTFTTITGTTNLGWLVTYFLWVRTSPPGATQGTVYTMGTVDMGIPITSSQLASTLIIGGGTASVTVDTSGQGAAGVGVTLNITWGTSSASNTLTTQAWMLRSLN